MRFLFSFFLVLVFSATGISKSIIIVNFGYYQNNTSYIHLTEFNNNIKSLGTGHAFNINFGVKNINFENGIFYGIGRSVVVSDVYVVNNIGRFSMAKMCAKQNFGFYSNFYLSSLEKMNFLPNDLNIYLTAKIGGYYLPSILDGHGGKFKPYGFGFNCYGGFGSSYLVSKKFGLFGEIGYNYYPVINDFVSMSKVAFRIGLIMWCHK